MAQHSKYIAKLLSDQDIVNRGYREVVSEGDYSLKGITNLANRNEFIRNRYVVGGLYDPAIFGLVGSCKCYHTHVTPNEAPVECPICHVKTFGTEEELSKVNGYYRLPFAVVSPIKIDNLYEKMKSNGVFVSLADNLASDYEKLRSICFASYDRNGRHELSENTDINTIGLDGLYELDDYKIAINKLLIIPSTIYRPCYPKKDKKTKEIALNMAGDTDTGTKLCALLSYVNWTRSKLPDHLTVDDYATIKFNFAWLMYCFFRGSKILEGGKFHEVRDLTRSTIESSLRATISPALDLELDKIRIPRSLAYHAVDEEIITQLMDMDGYTKSAAIREFNNSTPLANKYFEEIIENSVCLLWRNPTLHKNSVFAVNPILWDEISINIPIELCKSMNADFDGDQVGVAIITDPEQVKFMRANMTADKIFIYERSNEPLYIPTNEIVMGSYFATSTKESKDNGKSFKTLEEATKALENNEIEYDEYIRVDERKDTYGRLKFSDIMNVDIAEVTGDKAIASGDWAKVITLINKNPDRVKRLNDVKKFAAYCITVHGLNVPFDHVYNLDDEKIQEILDSDNEVAVKRDMFNSYLTKSVKEQLTNLPDSNMNDIIKSKSRVKDQILNDIFAPVIKLDKDGTCRIERNGSMFDGLSESSFVNKSLDNRIVQQMKKGQVPLSGYITRQMVLSSSSIIYEATKSSPDTTGIAIKMSEASGRTMMNGHVITQQESDSNPEQIVRVKSCLNHTQSKVFYDEVSRDYNLVDKSTVSINFATAFSEFLTQTALGLKHGRHGGAENSVNQVRALHEGVVTREGRFLHLNYGTGIDTYYVSDSTKFRCNDGAHVSRGQLLLELTKPTPEGVALGQLAELFGLQCTQEYEYLRRISPKGMCYSPIDGVIGYSSRVKRGSNKIQDIMTISNGSDKPITIDLSNYDELIFKPEGSTVKKGERISTGIIDLQAYSSYVPRLETFDLMKRQCAEILPGKIIRSEIYEVLFKCIESSLSVGKIIKSNRGDTDLLNRVYYGATNQALRSYFKKKDEYELDQTMTLSLLFPDSMNEEE